MVGTLGFIPILLNLLKIQTDEDGAQTSDNPAVAGVLSSLNAWWSEQIGGIRAWFRAQAYGALDISLIVMGVCIFMIALIMAASSEIDSVADVATKVAANANAKEG